MGSEVDNSISDMLLSSGLMWVDVGVESICLGVREVDSATMEAFLLCWSS